MTINPSKTPARISLNRQDYNKVHYWIRKLKGKPQLCESCGTTKGFFDWSNISGTYKYEVSDWQRLCKPCHHRHDQIRIKGVETAGNRVLSIRDQGLQVFIDSLRPHHPLQYGYDDWVWLWKVAGLKGPALGRIWKRSANRMLEWQNIWEEEQRARN